MAKEEKKKIQVTVVDNILYDIDGQTLDQVIEYLTQVKTEHLEFFDFYLNKDWDGEYTTLEIYAYRWETDDEYTLRIKTAEQQKKYRARIKREQEKEEYQTYLKLKDKYDK